MEASRDGYSGLYTLHFSNLFPPETNSKSNTINNNIKGKANTVANTSSSSPTSSLTQFTNWHVLLRMSVENEMWFVQPEAKVFSPTPSLASPSARGRRRNNEPVVNVTLPDGIPIVPIHQKDRKCTVINEMYETFGWNDENTNNHTEGINNTSSMCNGSSSGTAIDNISSNTKGKDKNVNCNNDNTVGKSKQTPSLVSLSSFASSSPISPEYSLRLQLHFDHFERELLGLSKDDLSEEYSSSSNKKMELLHNVTLICNAHKECGWHMGEVSVKLHDNKEISLPMPLRFVLKPYYGVRCTFCADPVYAVGFTCEQCEMTNYCSRECMQSHLRSSYSSSNSSGNNINNNTVHSNNVSSHGWLCDKLKEEYGVHGGKVVSEISSSSSFSSSLFCLSYVLNAWWRCGEHGMFHILVDGRPPFMYPMEFTLSLLEDAAETGIQYRLIVKEEDYDAVCSNINSLDDTKEKNDSCTCGEGMANAITATNNSKNSKNSVMSKTNNANNIVIPSEEMVLELFSLLLREVNRCAILDGCITLSSTCLNYLSHYSSLSSELVLYSHILFFTAFHLEEFIGPVTTIEEYVCYSRPLHALALLEIETALQATVSAEFWRRIKIAKDVLVALLTINTNRPCENNTAMQLVIMRQQCETFSLLSNTYVIIATRAPQEDAVKWLEQAEKCLRQCCKNTNLRHDTKLQAKMYFRLSVLLLLFDDKIKRKEAMTLRRLGEAILSPEWNEEIEKPTTPQSPSKAINDKTETDDTHNEVDVKESEPEKKPPKQQHQGKKSKGNNSKKNGNGNQRGKESNS